jgi:predicted ArsR family transcriptional regulator
MSAQLSLLEGAPLRALARATDPITSHQAAAKAGPLVHVHVQLIRDAFRKGGDGTIYELAARVGLTHVQVARRMPDLLERGQVFVTGETRLSPSGRACRVWGAF